MGNYVITYLEGKFLANSRQLAVGLWSKGQEFISYIFFLAISNVTVDFLIVYITV